MTKKNDFKMVRKTLNLSAKREVNDSKECIEKIASNCLKSDNGAKLKTEKYYTNLQKILENLELTLDDEDAEFSIDDIVTNINMAKKQVIDFVVENNIDFDQFKDIICNNEDGNYKFNVLGEICLRRPVMLNQIYFNDKQLCELVIRMYLIQDEIFCKKIKSSRLIKPQIKEAFGFNLDKSKKKTKETGNKTYSKNV